MFTFNKVLHSVGVVNIKILQNLSEENLKAIFFLINKFGAQKVEKELRKSSITFLKILTEKLTGRTIESLKINGIVIKQESIVFS